MPQSTPLNPIQLRLQTLEGHWNEFAAEPSVRILRWIADDDSIQLIQTFIDLQSEPVSEIPDLFIELKSPFLSAANWNSQLLEEFSGIISANRTDIEALGIVLRWNPPPAEVATTLNSLLDSLVAFTKSVESLAEHVAIAINPAAVAEPQQLSLWLQQLAKLPIPEPLRFIVIDPAAHPRFQGLEASPIVRSVDPQLNMPQAYEQIAAEAGPPGPGHDFRRYYVAVTNAAGSGDTAKAEQAATKAIEIALREKWHHLACTAQMALGAAWLAAGQPEKMLAACQTSIQYLHGLTDEVSKKLLVTLRMSEGSACIAAAQNSAAAAAFQRRRRRRTNHRPPRRTRILAHGRMVPRTGRTTTTRLGMLPQNTRRRHSAPTGSTQSHAPPLGRRNDAPTRPQRQTTPAIHRRANENASR